VSTASKHPSTEKPAGLATDWPGRRMDFADLATRLAARCVEIDPIDVPRGQRHPPHQSQTRAAGGGREAERGVVREYLGVWAPVIVIRNLLSS
jgi:hypothetical protein